MQLFRELVSKGLYEMTCLKLCHCYIVTTVYCVSDFEGTIFIFSKYSFEFEN